MYLLRVRGKNFLGLKQFDVNFPDDAFCIVGPNMSGKSTTGRAVLWACTGKFPVGKHRYLKDMALPGVIVGNGDTKKVKKRNAGKLGATVVQLYYAVPHSNGELKTFIITRSLYQDKLSFTLRDETGVYNFRDNEAQDIFLSHAKVPNVGTLDNRVNLFFRLRWFGVGQGESIFSSSSKERKSILESINEASKFNAWMEEAKGEYKQQQDLLKEKETGLAEQNGVYKDKVATIKEKLEEMGIKIPDSVISDDPKEFSKYIEGIISEMTAGKTLSEADIESELTKLRKKIHSLEANMGTKARYESLKEEIKACETQLSTQGSKTELETKRKENQNAIDKLEQVRTNLHSLNENVVKKQGLENNLKLFLSQREMEEKALKDLSDAKESTISNRKFGEKIVSLLGLEPPKGNGSKEQDPVRLNHSFHDDLSRLAQGDGDSLKEKIVNTINKNKAVIQDEKLALLKAKEEELSKQLKHIKDTQIELRLVEAEVKAFLPEVNSIKANINTLREELSKINKEEEAKLAVIKSAGLLLSTLKVENLKPKSSEPYEEKQFQGYVYSLKEILGVDQDEITTKALENLIILHNEQKTKIEELESEIKKRLKEKTDVTSELYSKTKKLEELNKKLEKGNRILSTASEEGYLCDECGSELSKDHLQKHKDELLDKINALSVDIEGIKEMLVKIEDIYGVFEKNYEDAKSKFEITTSKITKVKQLSVSLVSLEEGLFSHITKQKEDINLKIKSSEQSVIDKEKENEESVKRHKRINDAASQIVSEGSGDINHALEEKLNNLSSEYNSIKESLDELSIKEDAASNKLTQIAEKALYFLEMAGSGDESLLITRINEELTKRDEALKTNKESIEELNQKILVLEIEIEDASSKISSILGGVSPNQFNAVLKESIEKEKTTKLEIINALEKFNKIEEEIARKKSAIEEISRNIDFDFLNENFDFETKLKTLKSEEEELNLNKMFLSYVSNIKKLHSDINIVNSNIVKATNALEELQDRVNALTVIRGLLSPDGDARSLSLANDISTVVYTTNQYLESLSLDKTLTIDLKLAKDETNVPAIELEFEVDGVGGVLPSYSQENIIRLLMDLSVRNLAGCSGFAFFDEPERGLNAVNGPKIARFLREVSEQTGVITNVVSDGFEHVISTEDVRNSCPDGISDEELGIETGKKTKSSDDQDDSAPPPPEDEYPLDDNTEVGVI